MFAGAAATGIRSARPPTAAAHDDTTKRYGGPRPIPASLTSAAARPASQTTGAIQFEDFSIEPEEECAIHPWLHATFWLTATVRSVTAGVTPQLTEGPEIVEFPNPTGRKYLLFYDCFMVRT